MSGLPLRDLFGGTQAIPNGFGKSLQPFVIADHSEVAVTIAKLRRKPCQPAAQLRPLFRYQVQGVILQRCNLPVVDDLETNTAGSLIPQQLQPVPGRQPKEPLTAVNPLPQILIIDILKTLWMKGAWVGNYDAIDPIIRRGRHGTGAMLFIPIR